MPKARKVYPVLYASGHQDLLYRSGSVNPTLYFEIVPDAGRLESDPDYRDYFRDMTENEMFRAIISRFILSQPLMVRNEGIPFILFKTNMDPWNLENFCRSIVQEISFHTGIRHQAFFGLEKTMLVKPDARPGKLAFLSAGLKGEPLTRRTAFEQFRKPLDFEGEPADQSILYSLAQWKEENRRKALAARQEEEEIVLW